MKYKISMFLILLIGVIVFNYSRIMPLVSADAPPSLQNKKQTETEDIKSKEHSKIENARHRRHTTPKVITNTDDMTYFKEIAYNQHNPCMEKGQDCGSPLKVTTYLEAGNIQKAMELSAVTTDAAELSFVKSYSGFFTVDAATNSNMFFWFFPAMMRSKNAPVVIWLQGGPGQSALFDIFNGFGPYRISRSLTVKANPYTLIKNVSVLYLDNPIGTGFSFTDVEEGYAKKSREVADQLYEALVQFFTMFKLFIGHNVYISGEGYGAKFAVALMQKINSQTGRKLVNIKGVILGNPDLDPEITFQSGHYLFEMGYLNPHELHLVTQHLDQARRSAQRHSYSEALSHVHRVFGSPYRVPINQTSYIPRVCGVTSQYNVMEFKDDESLKLYESFVNKTNVRKAIHVGHVAFQDGRNAYISLTEDLLQAVGDGLSKLLNENRVMIYNGINDKKVPYSLSLKILQKIHWRYLNEYQNATGRIWKLNERRDDITGYIKGTRKFISVVLRRSGHLVAKDQPEAAVLMMNAFIFHKPWHTLMMS